jgi:hypothetical protein
MPRSRRFSASAPRATIPGVSRTTSSGISTGKARPRTFRNPATTIRAREPSRAWLLMDVEAKEMSG